MSDIEQSIRERAFLLWEQAGRPHHRGDEFWFTAREQIHAESLPSSDAPGDLSDFPPDERTLEDPPDAPVQPGEAMQEHGSIDPEIAQIAVPDIHPAEPAAADARAARVAPPAKGRARSAPSVAASAARQPADTDEAAAPARRPRTGAARPPSSRPAPSRPGRT